MRLEVEFFNAAATAHALPQLGVLVLDFDETLTETDSTSVIINTAIQAAAEARGTSCRLYLLAAFGACSKLHGISKVAECKLEIH